MNKMDKWLVIACLVWLLALLLKTTIIGFLPDNFGLMAGSPARFHSMREMGSWVLDLTKHIPALICGLWLYYQRHAKRSLQVMWFCAGIAFSIMGPIAFMVWDLWKERQK